MCPSWLATRDEKDTTRGRSRVLQEAVNGALVRGLASPEVHEALDLCLACKGCLSDCPTGVDMATYKAEVLHQTYRGRPRPAAHYSLGWLPRWAAAASRAPRLANLLLATPPLAAAAKRLGGIDPAVPSRGSPPRPSAPGGAAARRVGRPRRPAPGCSCGPTPSPTTSHPRWGRPPSASEDAGYRVDLPDEPLCCGLTWISTGQLDTAKRVLRRTVDRIATLGPCSRHGGAGTVVPGGAAARRARPARAGRPGGRGRGPGGGDPGRGAGGRPGWDPPDLSGVAVVAQPHCHQHAVLGWAADRDLLARAGAEVTAVGGCCGLAGNFGAERGHHDVSVAVAETALLPAVRAAGPDAVVLADGFSCRTQLDHLAAAGPSTWPSPSTRPDIDPRPRAPGPLLGAELLVEEVVLLGPEVEAAGRGAWRSASGRRRRRP